MPYSKQTWVDGSPSTPLSAARLGHLESGVKAASDAADAARAEVEGRLSEANLNATIAGQVEAAADVIGEALGELEELTTAGRLSDPALTAKIVEAMPLGVQAASPYIEQSAAWAAADAAGLTEGPDWNTWMGFGSSTVNGLASRLGALAGTYSASYIDGSGSGQCAEQILARLGSRPLRTGGFAAIPASGSVVIASSNVSAAINAAVSFRGHWEGHPERPGTLSKASGYQAGYTFTPDAPGSAFTLPLDAAFIPEPFVKRDAILIANIGKNNATGTPGGTSNMALVNEWVIDALNWMRAKGHPVLYLGHFVDTNTPASSPIRDRVNLHNATMAARLGDRYLSMDWLYSADVWADAAVTPTSADLTQQALGNKPPSLSSDDLHLNGTANNLLRDKIAQRVAALGWKSGAVPVESLLAASFYADDISGADGADVTSWVSREGSITGLTLVPITNAPELNVGGFQGHKTVIMDNANSEAMQTPTGALSLLAATYVLIGRLVSNTGSAQTWLSGDGSGWQRLYTNSNGQNNYISGSGSNEILSPVITPTGEWQIIVARFNGASSSLRVNGAEATGTTSASTQTRLRLAVNAGGTSARAHLELAALDVYNGALNDEQVLVAVQRMVDQLSA